MSRRRHGPIKRLSPTEQDRTDEVWRCCRYCGDEIPPSTRSNAYCTYQCKSRNHSRETGMDV